MDEERVRLGKEKETYLATLYGKALDAAVTDPILGDRCAAETVARIDYDFEELKLPSGGEITLPMRDWHFDQWTRAFLAANPESTVLDLGCGLDTRVYRIDPGPKVRWYDVDFPDVIALRERLYPRRNGHSQLGSSVTDLAWLSAIPGDTPVMVVAEGLLMYLQEKDGQALLRAIVGHFPCGQIAFDAYNGAMVRLVSRLAAVRGAQVELLWGVDDPHDLENEVPSLRLIDSVEFLAMPDLVRRLSRTWYYKAIYGTMIRLPFYRNLILHLLYQFTRENSEPAS